MTLQYKTYSDRHSIFVFRIMNFFSPPLHDKTMANQIASLLFQHFFPFFTYMGRPLYLSQRRSLGHLFRR